MLEKRNAEDPDKATIIQERWTSHSLGEPVKHGFFRLRITILIPVSQKTIAGTQMVCPILGATRQIQTKDGISASSLIVVKILLILY